MNESLFFHEIKQMARFAGQPGGVQDMWRAVLSQQRKAASPDWERPLNSTRKVQISKQAVRQNCYLRKRS
jgi:hypothetical protein